MGQLNKVIITGNLTNDPIMDQTTQEKKDFCLIQIANHTESQENSGFVNFIQCIGWGGVAQALMDKARKGDEIFIEGRINQTQWKKDGETRSKIQIYIQQFQIIRRKE